MPQIDVNGTGIHYEFSGLEDGPFLVFGNSLGTNLHMWDDQAAALAGRYRIMRYDSRGHGRSGAPDGAYTLDLLAGDLVRLLNALGIGTFDYCGLSKGGMIGQWLGVNLGSRVRRLVLCNTSGFPPPAALWDGRIEAVMQGGMEAIVGSVIERWFTPGFIAADPQGVDRVRSMLLTTPPQGYAGCFAAIMDMDQAGLRQRDNRSHSGYCRRQGSCDPAGTRSADRRHDPWCPAACGQGRRTPFEHRAGKRFHVGFLGFPGRRGGGLMADEIYEDGMAVRRDMLGPEHVAGPRQARMPSRPSSRSSSPATAGVRYGPATVFRARPAA